MAKVKNISISKIEDKEVTLADLYTPIGNEVIIEVNYREATDSGIIFAEKYTQWDGETERLVKKDNENRKDPVCKVISIGPDVTRVKVGDLVLVGSRAYPVINLLDDERHFQCRELDILGQLVPNYRELQMVYRVKAKAETERKRKEANQVASNGVLKLLKKD